MSSAPVTPLRSFRTLAAALMGAIVLIGIALSFVVGSRQSDRNGRVVHTHAPSAGIYIAIVVIGAVAAVLIQIFGYRFRGCLRTST